MLFKLLALFTMLIDHIGVIFLQSSEYTNLYEVFRGIGRLAFPIFGYFIVRNYLYYTTDRYLYMKRIFLLALISTPFHFFVNDGFVLNILYTFFLFMFILQVDNNKIFDRYTKLLIQIFLSCFSIFVEYNIFGLLMLFSLHLYFRASTPTKSGIYALLFLLSVHMSNFFAYPFYSSIAVIAILFYDFVLSSREPKPSKKLQYFFYLFYPGHLAILSLIKGIS